MSGAVVDKSEAKTVLERKFKALGEDKVMRGCMVVGFLFTFIDLVTSPKAQSPIWLHILGVPMILTFGYQFIHYRLFALVPGILVAMAGASISLWYDFTGTKRPPSDQYTGLTLLAGLLVFTAGISFYALQNRREKASRQDI